MVQPRRLVGWDGEVAVFQISVPVRVRHSRKIPCDIVAVLPIQPTRRRRRGIVIVVVVADEARSDVVRIVMVMIKEGRDGPVDGCAQECHHVTLVHIRKFRQECGCDMSGRVHPHGLQRRRVEAFPVQLPFAKALVFREGFQKVLPECPTARFGDV